MTDVELSLPFPLDSDGFLRRACPSCCLDFKWRPDDSRDESTSTREVYFCPYCRAEALPNEWFTSEQVAYIQDEVMEQVVNPSLDDLAQSVRAIERASGGLISGRLDIPPRQHAPPIFESDDMRLVNFSCHPDEPLKVAEDWTGEVHCLMCGESTDASIH